MNVLHLGLGARHRLWVEVVERHAGARNAGLVTADASPTAASPGMTCFRSLDDALANVGAEVAIVSGHRATDWATQALLAGMAVVMDEVGAVDRTAFLRFRQAAQTKDSSVSWPRRGPYSRCGSVLKRLIRSRAVGAIGHVSCIDRAALSGGNDGRSSQVSAGAFAHFQGLRELFGDSPKKVMARLGSGPGAQTFTQAFIEFESGMHIHYSGCLGAASDEHQLWIEGTGGSVKSDGRAVWWRKRGWRFFAPLKFDLARVPRQAADAKAALEALTAARKHAADLPQDLSAVATVAAAVESHRRLAAVAMSELEG